MYVFFYPFICNGCIFHPSKIFCPPLSAPDILASPLTCTSAYRCVIPSCAHVCAWLGLKLLHGIVTDTEKDGFSKKTSVSCWRRWNRGGSGGVAPEGRKRPGGRGGADPHLSDLSLDLTAHPQIHQTTLQTHPASLCPNFEALTSLKI